MRGYIIVVTFVSANSVSEYEETVYKPTVRIEETYYTQAENSIVLAAFVQNSIPETIVINGTTCYRDDIDVKGHSL